MMMVLVFEIMASFTEIIIGILMNGRLLGGREAALRKSAVAAGMITVGVFFLNQVKLFSVFTTVVGIIGIVISSFLIYKVKIIDAMVLSVLYLSLIYVIDFFSISLLGNVFRVEDFAYLAANSVTYARMWAMFVSKSLLILIYGLIRKHLCNVRLRIWKVCMGSMLSVVIIYLLVNDTLKSTDQDVFLIWFLLMILFLTGIYFFLQYTYLLLEKGQMELMAERNKLLAERYQAVIQNYQSSQVFFHDLKNQYLVLENFLKNKEYEKAYEYMKKMNYPEYKDMTIRWTGMEVLDTLLNYKKAEAERAGISMEIQSDHIHLALQEQEIAALFGNILDNAIEACTKMEDDEKWIKIVIKKIEEMTFIKVTNSYMQEPVQKDHTIISDKPNKYIHGFGISSIEMIVDRYGGTMKMDYGLGVFSLVISFCN